ncbi:hypothetical protein AYO38_03565 [bacterium SCGC AG-212-C10]|nr:hypothetical protein AYO38_03565 [bacterium SCGC AG-212-C10]
MITGMSERDRAPISRAEAPFYRFMFAILDAYHEEGIRDRMKLGAYAKQLLAREPLPEIPAGLSREEFATGLVEKVDRMSGIDPAISVSWLMDALVAWNDCAEVYLWTSNIIEGREHAQVLMQPFYVLAIECLKRRLGPFPLGQPGIPASSDERKMAKALVGLGESLATDLQTGEATGRYLEALRWDPDDSEGARPRLAISLTLHGDTESAAAVITQAKPTIFGLYAGAVVAYAQTEGTGPARKALLNANMMNPDVANILTGRRKMLGMLTGKARFDEAQYVCLMLAPVVNGMPGFSAWVKREIPAGPMKKGRR